MKILIIDDDAQIRDILRIWFEQEGFNVVEAANGREGVKIQRSSPADMLVCDLIMPDQEGIETIAGFKKEFPRVGIIAISGGGKIGPDSYLEIAVQLGAWKAFKKPLDIPLLVEAIREWSRLSAA
ncbi:MAG: response regulator [Desulfocapsaceae bacterium]|jgi:DNA-binding NtrC family response regulator|nr:response regulator [Desulfocapsaceae bacterium]